MSPKTKGICAIFLAAILWSSAGTAGKLLFESAPPFVAAFHRFALASLIILPFFLREKKKKGYVTSLLPLGVFNAGNILFYYSGLNLTSANTAVILGTAVPLVTAILAPIVIKETVARGKIAGVIIGLLGALLIVVLPVLHSGHGLNGNLLGNLLLVGSLLCWSFYILSSRKILSSGTHSALSATAINLFTVAVASAIAALVNRQALFPAALSVPSYLGVLAYASVVMTIATFFLFQWGVQFVSASTASLKEYIQLAGGVLINAVVLGERLSFSYAVGTALIVIGVLIATHSHLTKRRATALFSQGE